MEKVSTTTRIFSTVARDLFVGRAAELERLLELANSKGVTTGMALLAPPAAGASELLTQVYDRLFVDQQKIIPFYFRLRRQDQTAIGAARRFCHELVAQTVAFRSKDPSIAVRTQDPQEIAELATEDADWIRAFIHACGSEDLHDERS